jgi:hypothetical protein
MIMKKEKSQGLHNFLPSLNEHKKAIMRGTSGRKIESSVVEETEEKKRMKRKSFARSNTLLNSIKEDYKPDEKVGVVPKDLGFDFLKDLLEEQEIEKDRIKEQKKKE